MKPKLSSRTKKLQENVNVNVIGQPPVTPIFVGTRWGEGVLPKDDMVCTYKRPFIKDVINFLRFLTPPLPPSSSLLLNKLIK